MICVRDAPSARRNADLARFLVTETSVVFVMTTMAASSAIRRWARRSADALGDPEHEVAAARASGRRSCPPRRVGAGVSHGGRARGALGHLGLDAILARPKMFSVGGGP